MKIQFFTEIGCTQSLHFFSVFIQLWTHFYPGRRPKLKKLNIPMNKTTSSGYPKIAKSRPYLVPIFQEKYNYFLSYFGCFLLKKGAWWHFKGSESKSHLAYAGAMVPGVLNMQRVWSHHFLVLSFVESKDIFFKFGTTFSKLAAFLVTTPTFFWKMSLISWCRI